MPRKSAAARLKAKSLEVKEAGKKVTLKSSDGKVLDVEENVLLQSETIKHMIEDGCVGDAIPLPNVTGDILEKVIEFCKMHVGKKKVHTLEWDKEFMKVDIQTLCHLISAANYLEIESLLDLACQTVAERIKEKTPEGIRRMFNIKNDFSPKEEEQIRKETPWAFE